MITKINATELFNALAFAYENFALVVVDRHGIIFIANEVSAPK